MEAALPEEEKEQACQDHGVGSTNATCGGVLISHGCTLTAG